MRRRLGFITSAAGTLCAVACGIQLDGGSVPAPDASTPGTGTDALAPDADGADGADGALVPTIVDVVSHKDRACIVRSDGVLKCWGRNQAGQLGLGDRQTRGDKAGQMGAALPRVSLGAGRAVRSVALGEEHTCGILDDGKVKCWGSNYAGQLGLGDTRDRGVGPAEMGDALPAVNLGGTHTAKALALGTGHSCAILDDDSVKCWGQNAVGQLGLGDSTDRGRTAGSMGDALPVVSLGALRKAKAIAAGEAHTCAILDNNALKCWGIGAQGQLGLGDGAYHGNEPGEMGDALLPVNLGTGRHAVAIGAGQRHTCAVLDDKTLKCWGAGGAGQLGQGSSTTLGNGLGEMGDALAPVDLGVGRTVLGLAVGWTHTCAVTDDRQLRCFGANAEGQLGPTTSSPWGDGPGEMGANLPTVMLGVGRTVLRGAGGGDHTCALLDDGKVKCWGNNADGQLGQGDTQDRGKNASEMGDALTPISLF